jgi:hypothetical protein
MAQIRRAYDILNALAVLQPTDGLRHAWWR